jgi:hypothetical protein
VTAIADSTWREAFALASLLAGVGTLLNGIELIIIRRELAPGGLLSWTDHRPSHPNLRRSTAARWIDRMLAPRAFFVLVAIQLSGSLAILARPSDPPVWALTCVLTIQMLYNVRNRTALIGADQMHVIVLAGCLIQALFPDSFATYASAVFVTAQLFLAYVTSGVAKAVSPTWRDGTAIRQIARSEAVGLRSLHGVIGRYPVLAPVLCWAAIAFEVAFPWLMFGGTYAALVFFVSGVMFHLTIATVMGLDLFLWAYVAAYPIAFRCSAVFDRVWFD